MRALVTLVLGSILLLQGCPTTRINRLPASAPLSKPLTLTSDGEFVHKPSRYAFPVAIGGFQRTAMSQYDTKGLDVSVGYGPGLKECPVVLTIYVAPAPRMTFIGAEETVVRSLETRWLDSAYDHWKREIMQSHPDAILESEDQKTQLGAPGKKAVYTFGDRESKLYVFLVDLTWFLTYRETYPQSCSDQANAAIQDFFSQWRGRDH